MGLVTGCEVYAVDINEDSRRTAKEMGCAGVFDKVSDLNDVQPELIVDFVGGDITNQAIKAVAFKGVVVLVGMSSDKVTVDVGAPDALIMKEVQLRGCGSSSNAEIAGCLELYKNKGFNPKIVTFPFEEFEAAVEKFEKHEFDGRPVAVFD